ncbi:H-NS histone family protein [Ramlibacter sp. AW1]|uniref:H-NS histone family protein n=1 Tax=Ramlibacter aurantiacus TaxID=2801330 RepID=A0A936ZRW2_9BURK|nr:H-NS histone family protein [Ramlibacter aurantiacus]MBL0419940.1 H-NS histone family protein [Ramlibacter aurantiacus]
MAKKTYAEIQAEIARLQQEAESVREAEVAGVIERMREAIEVYGITARDLGFSGSESASASRGGRRPAGRAAGRRAAAGADGAPKYRDPSGQVWSGRGPRPRWLREALESGRSLEEFRVG